MYYSFGKEFTLTLDLFFPVRLTRFGIEIFDRKGKLNNVGVTNHIKLFTKVPLEISHASNEKNKKKKKKKNRKQIQYT